jgi:hypothetical protein
MGERGARKVGVAKCNAGERRLLEVALTEAAEERIRSFKRSALRFTSFRNYAIR